MPNDLSTLAAQLDVLWQNNIELACRQNAEVQSARAHVQAAASDAGVPNQDFSLWPSEPDLRAVFNGYVELLDKALRHTLHTACVPIPQYKITDFNDWDEEALRRLYRRKRDEEAFDVLVAYAKTRQLYRIASALWEELNPQSAAQLGIAQAAVRIQSYFGGYHSGEPKKIVVRGPNRVITSHVPTQWGSAWVLSYDGARSLNQTCSDLLVLFQASVLPSSVAPSLVHAAQCVFDQREYQSRMKIELGPGLNIVMFKEYMEYIFTPQALEALQVVIAKNVDPSARRA